MKYLKYLIPRSILVASTVAPVVAQVAASCCTGWVPNMGGPHGTPAVPNVHSIVKARRARA